VQIVGLDRPGNSVERDQAIGLVLQRLRLDRAEHCHTAALVPVGVRALADQDLVAALAVRHQRGEVALRSARHEQSGFEAEHFRHRRKRRRPLRRRAWRGAYRRPAASPCRCAGRRIQRSPSNPSSTCSAARAFAPAPELSIACPG